MTKAAHHDFQKAFSSVLSAVNSLKRAETRRGIKGPEQLAIREKIKPLTDWLKKYRPEIKEAKDDS